MKLSTKVSAVAIAALTPAGLVLSAGPANASGPTHDFRACSNGSASECIYRAYSAGTIVWNTVGLPTVGGSVYMPKGESYTVKVTFDAFLDREGGSRVDSANRAVTPSDPDGARPFGFDIGKTYRINRIKVTVCVHETPQSPADYCGYPRNYYRPA